MPCSADSTAHDSSNDHDGENDKPDDALPRLIPWRTPIDRGRWKRRVFFRPCADVMHVASLEVARASIECRRCRTIRRCLVLLALRTVQNICIVEPLVEAGHSIARTQTQDRKTQRTRSETVDQKECIILIMCNKRSPAAVAQKSPVPRQGGPCRNPFRAT